MSSNSSAGGFAPADWLMSAFKQNPEGVALASGWMRFVIPHRKLGQPPTVTWVSELSNRTARARVAHAGAWQ
jgi:hypothetical protein